VPLSSLFSSTTTSHRRARVGAKQQQQQQQQPGEDKDEMQKIPLAASSGGSGSNSSSSSSSSADSGSLPAALTGNVTILGRAVPRWVLLAIGLLALFTGGLRGLLAVGLVGGAVFLAGGGGFSVSPSAYTSSPSSSAGRRTGGLSNVRGMGDLPQTQAKGC